MPDVCSFPLPETVDSYYEAPEIHLPLHHPDNSDIPDLIALKVRCVFCKKPTYEFRGAYLVHPTCLDIHIAGGCDECRAVTWARFRWYGHHITQLKHGQWNLHPLINDSILNRLRSFLKRLFYRSRQ
jgi:hypothetical protein